MNHQIISFQMYYQNKSHYFSVGYAVINEFRKNSRHSTQFNPIVIYIYIYIYGSKKTKAL